MELAVHFLGDLKMRPFIAADGNTSKLYIGVFVCALLMPSCIVNNSDQAVKETQVLLRHYGNATRVACVSQYEKLIRCSNLRQFGDCLSMAGAMHFDDHHVLDGWGNELKFAIARSPKDMTVIEIVSNGPNGAFEDKGGDELYLSISIYGPNGPVEFRIGGYRADRYGINE